MFTQKTTILGTIIAKLVMAITLIVPMLTIQVAPVQAGTNVGGPIISDTTWTLANSPYIVIANVDVQQNVTLTIDPGVIVKFTNGTKLQVNGELVARGTDDKRITFTSNQSPPNPGDWGNIEFTILATPTTTDLDGNYVSGSILQYCTVEYAGQSTSSAIDALNILIDNCIVRNNDTRGISARNSIVRGSTVSANLYNDILSIYGGGIYAIDNSRVLNNTVYDNEIPGYGLGGGIYAEDSTVSGNIVYGNKSEVGGGISARDSLVISNTVSNNWRGGISGGHIISGNIVIGNMGVGIDGGGTIVNNLVLNNTATGWGGGMNIKGGSTIVSNIIGGNIARGCAGLCVTVSGPQTTVMSNTIVANHAYDYANAGAGAYFSAGAPVIFMYNTIVGNSGPIDSTAGGLGVNCEMQVHYNTFYSNTPYDVSVNYSFNISGTHNYWGTVANVDILAQIYDWYDNDRLGKFLYIPYLQEPSPDAPLPPPTDLSVNFQNDSVTLTWDALPSFTTGWGYKVYYDTDDSMPPFVGTGLNEGDSPIDIGANTSYTLTGLDPNTDYYFAVTAYDNLGREGWYSNVARKLGGYWVYLPLVIKK